MKTELRLRQHSVWVNHYVIELWYDDKFIGTVTGADGPGVRVISKHPMCAGEDSPSEKQTPLKVPVNVTAIYINYNGSAS